MSVTQKALALAILIVAAAHYVGPTNHRVRNYEVMPEMLVSIPYDAQAANPNFADGQTMRAPVPGTIARGFAPPSANGRLLDLTLPWKELDPARQRDWDAFAPPAAVETTPEERAATAARDLARGEAVFVAICATCHGGSGAGDGPVTKRGVPPPPSLALPNAREMSDGHMFRVISVGQGNMAAHAAQVTRADRWRVIRFVRTLQKQ